MTEKGGHGRALHQQRPRKVGDLQRMQQESPMKEQAVRIVNTSRVESLLQSIVTWKQLSEKEKKQWHQS